MTEPSPEWPATWPGGSGPSWVTPEEVESWVAIWPDAAELEDEVLALFLTAAWEQCSSYAPALPEGQDVPSTWRLAQVMQARALYRNATAGRDDQITSEGYTVTVYPMDLTVKNLLRPKRGRYLIR